MRAPILFTLVLQASVSFGQTQSELNATAALAFHIADSTLSATYEQVLKEYGHDEVFASNLKAAQARWLEWRGAELEAKYPKDRKYGSVQPMCRDLFLASMTTERIPRLHEWLDGTEEGDVCSGSVRSKQ